MKKVSCLFLFLFLCQYISAQHPEYGLHIQSYPLQASEFTSMVLEDGKPIETLGHKITLKFNIWVRNDNVFGTVFRIITNTNKNIDLMFSVGENDKRFPILVTGDAVSHIAKEVKCETWLPIQLTLHPKDGQITINYDSVQVKTNYKDLINAQSLRISFGYCPFDKFSLGDVASINLKDISLNRDNKDIRFWKMAYHNSNVCYDEIAQAPATCENARWIMDQYISWKPIYSKEFNSSPSIAFDPTIGTFYMATDKNKLYVFHSDKYITDTIMIKGGEFVSNYPNQLIYIPERQQLLSYNLDENIYSIFDPSTLTWKGNRTPSKEHDYWNNTIAYNPSNESLVSFGGYGHYHYNNELLISFPWSENKPQEKVNLTNIHPRYTMASVIVGNTFYIFGGRGCPSGRQELSPRNYYDLYAVNLPTKQVSKLWEWTATPKNGDFQPGENMIYDAEKKCFYFFCSQQGGILMKAELEKPGFEPMSLPINLKMDSQYIYSNLYYSPQQKKLYAAVHQAKVSGKATLNIYEINYPPIPIQTFKQNLNNMKKESGRYTLWCIAGSVFFSILVGFVIFFQRKRENKKMVILAQKNLESVSQEPAGCTAKELEINDIPIPMPSAIPEFHNYDLSKKCICFFGGFKVIDKEGTDITCLFTPTLKTLLILLILYTGKESKGITSHKLIQLLWYDKTEKSAKNNRNVYMSKLRGLLEKVGNIKILNQNSFWSIQFEEDTQCDYLEALRLYRDDNQNVEKLLELLLKGVMLPNMEIDWIDTFKNEFSNNTIDLLCRLLKREDLSKNLRLKIADTLFQYDYINEEALCLKCQILCQQGKKGLAKTIYDTFCKEYSSSMGTEYEHTFLEIIEGEVRGQ